MGQGPILGNLGSEAYTINHLCRGDRVKISSAYEIKILN